MPTQTPVCRRVRMTSVSTRESGFFCQEAVLMLPSGMRSPCPPVAIRLSGTAVDCRDALGRARCRRDLWRVERRLQRRGRVPGDGQRGEVRGGDVREDSDELSHDVLPHGLDRLGPRHHGRDWRHGHPPRLRRLRRRYPAAHGRPAALRRQAARPGNRQRVLRGALSAHELGAVPDAGSDRRGCDRPAELESVRVRAEQSAADHRS
jgi:hypothetical protein